MKRKAARVDPVDCSVNIGVAANVKARTCLLDSVQVMKIGGLRARAKRRAPQQLIFA